MGCVVGGVCICCWPFSMVSGLILCQKKWFIETEAPPVACGAKRIQQLKSVVARTTSLSGVY